MRPNQEVLTTLAVRVSVVRCLYTTPKIGAFEPTPHSSALHFQPWLCTFVRAPSLTQTTSQQGQVSKGLCQARAHNH